MLARTKYFGAKMASAMPLPMHMNRPPQKVS
jgi:hypothetical protein